MLAAPCASSRSLEQAGAARASSELVSDVRSNSSAIGEQCVGQLGEQRRGRSVNLGLTMMAASWARQGLVFSGSRSPRLPRKCSRPSQCRATTGGAKVVGRATHQLTRRRISASMYRCTYACICICPCDAHTYIDVHTYTYVFTSIYKHS